MRMWTASNGYKIFRVLSGRCNTYLIQTDDQNILIDTGMKSAYKKLKKQLTTLNIFDISYLVLTHTHFDHCRSAKQIKEDFKCKIMISRNAKNSVLKGYTKIPDGTNALVKIISKIGQLIGKRLFGYPAFEADILVQEKYLLNSQNSDILITRTPGHSPDSISVIINNEIAIVGDALFGKFRHSVFPPFADNVYTMIDSWEKLLNTGCHTFLPGHGKEISRKFLTNQFNIRKKKA